MKKLFIVCFLLTLLLSCAIKKEKIRTDICSVVETLKIDKAPDILGDFNYFNLLQNKDCRLNGWEKLLRRGLYALTGDKKLGGIFFIDLACGYTLEEEQKFHKDCHAKLATENGRKAIYNWIIPTVKPIVNSSKRVTSSFSSTLTYLLNFDYQYEKAYYQRCAEKKSERDFVTINPKTKKLDWNRWLVSWVFRRINDGTFTQETVNIYSKQALSDLGLAN